MCGCLGIARVEEGGEQRTASEGERGRVAGGLKYLESGCLGS